MINYIIHAMQQPYHEFYLSPLIFFSPTVACAKNKTVHYFEIFLKFLYQGNKNSSSDIPVNH